MKKDPEFYAAVIVIDSTSRVLLGKRKEDGIWTTPAGGSNPGETPEDTAIRECFEESGLAIQKELLQLLPIIPTKNGKNCYCFLYICSPGHMVTSKLDPDEEVKKWEWFEKDQIPNGLRDDPRRFESVRNGFMKFHGIIKSMTETLEKGGNGSGIKGHKTNKVEELRPDRPNFDEMTRTQECQWNVDKYKRLVQNYPKNSQFKETLDEWKTRLAHWTKEENKVQKGGEGSGKKGHVTLKDYQHKVHHLADKLIEVNPFKSHLNKLKSGAVMEGVELRSGKPLYLDVNQALAHKYTPADYREAANIHYEKAQSMATQIEKIKEYKTQVPPEMEEIRKFHKMAFKQNMSMAETVTKRAAKTEQSIKDQVANYKEQQSGMKKSFDSQDEWVDRVSKLMENYSFGEEPRSIQLNKGTLWISKLDQDAYSAVFHGDTKVRVDRMTIPSLVDFCMAKSWIEPIQMEPQLAPVEVVQVNPIVSEMSIMDKRIKILELVSKLIG